MAYPEKHIAIVCNPTRENEKALRITNNIMLLLKGMDIRHSLFVDPWPRALEDFTEVWIVGGDGTVNWFINQYPQMQLPLSVFAGGSGNDFHWMIYGDMETEQQVEKVLEAQPRKIDAGICNERLFLNGVGIGFDGAIVKDLVGKKKLAGKASYLLSVMKHIIGYHEKQCTIELPAETLAQDCMMISVANARRYGGAFQVAPQASLTDELLDVNIVGRISPFNRMRYLPVIEKGEHLNLSFVQYRQAPHLKISAPEKLHAHIDGEYFFESSFELSILPSRFSFLY
jgi:diacylglycerol kinase (ATP)